MRLLRPCAAIALTLFVLAASSVLGAADAGGGHTAHENKAGGGQPAEHSAEAHAKADAEAAATSAAAGKPGVGITEKLGGKLADATFTDADGRRVRLSEIVTVPTIILPVYYRCPNVCHVLQGSFAQVLPKVDLVPGKDIRVVSLSFDARETPEDAARVRKVVETQLAGRYPMTEWTFLVGDQAAIDAALDSMGFHVERVGGIFSHPVAAVAVAPGGVVSRYLYGASPLPFDVTMALTEAAAGHTGLSIKRMLSYCYNYDPQGRRYVFDIMRVAGAVIVGTLLALFLVLLLAGRRKRPGGPKS